MKNIITHRYGWFDAYDRTSVITNQLLSGFHFICSKLICLYNYRSSYPEELICYPNGKQLPARMTVPVPAP
jgi:hypothetical protein